MITPPWELDAYAWDHISNLPQDQREYGLATFQHYYHNSYKVPCMATFLIWSLFLTIALASGLSAFIEHFFPRQHHAILRWAAWWRGNVSEHPLVSEKHSQVVSCGKGWFSWLTLHLPLRLEAILLVVMVTLNIVPLCTFYSLYVGHNTYFVGSDSISRRSQILRHLANRCAMLGIGQIPMLILLASKRTPIALLSQLSMNTMMLFHRWIARMFYLHIVIHALGNTLIFHFSVGFAQSLKQTAVQFGIAAIVMLSGLVFLSLRTLRKRHYEVFVFLHISMALLLIIFTYLHIKFLHQGRLGLQIFVIELAAAFWAFDRLVRLLGRVAMSLSWRYADGSGATRKAELTSYGDGAYTRVRIQVPASRLRLSPVATSSEVSPWIDLEDESKQRRVDYTDARVSGKLLDFARIGAGDDIRVSVPRLQWVGDHPFSVFAVGRSKHGDTNMGYVDLIIQRQAGLTQKLSDLAQELDSPPSDFYLGSSDSFLPSATRPKGKRVRVVIDGPFGRSPSLKGAQHAVLVAGGIAITFCYPLLVKAARGEFASLETCKLVWIVRNESILDVLRDGLRELLGEIARRGGSRCQLSIDIYLTNRAETPTTHTAASVVPREREGLTGKQEPTSFANADSPSLRLKSSSSTLVCADQTAKSASAIRSDFDSELLNSTESKQGKKVCGIASRGFDVAPSFGNRYSPKTSRESMAEADIGASPWTSDCSTFCKSEPLPPKLKGWQSHTHSQESSARGGPHPPRDDTEHLTSINYHSQIAHRGGTETPRSTSACSDCSTKYAEECASSGSFQFSVGMHSASPSLVLQHDSQFRKPLAGDVLSETGHGALIEIRRFRGRPASMAAVHRHITCHQNGAPAQRVVFATCGPAPMCDSVRAEVVSLLKKGKDVSLVEDCFNW